MFSPTIKKDSLGEVILSLILLQTPTQVTLKFLSTYDTGLTYWGRTRFIVMSSGQVVVWGKTSDETPAAFHIFSLTSAGWNKLKEVKRLCDHNSRNILPITVNNKEQLAVSCFDCETIKLYNLETLQVTTTFSNPKYYPGVMCHGENSKLFVLHSVKGYPVMELDCSGETFSGPSKIVQTGMESHYGFHYIPSPHRLIVLSALSARMIRAVSTETGEKVWEVTGEVDGAMIEPLGLLFSPEHQVLLVADGGNSRVLVLHPRDGSHQQTIQPDQYMGAIADLCLHQNKLVVGHTVGGKEKVSYFSIN